MNVRAVQTSYTKHLSKQYCSQKVRATRSSLQFPGSQPPTRLFLCPSSGQPACAPRSVPSLTCSILTSPPLPCLVLCCLVWYRRVVCLPRDRASATRASEVPSPLSSTGYTRSTRPPTTFRCGAIRWRLPAAAAVLRSAATRKFNLFETSYWECDVVFFVAVGRLPPTCRVPRVFPGWMVGVNEF